MDHPVYGELGAEEADPAVRELWRGTSEPCISSGEPGTYLTERHDQYGLMPPSKSQEERWLGRPTSGFPISRARLRQPSLIMAGCIWCTWVTAPTTSGTRITMGRRGVGPIPGSRETPRSPGRRAKLRRPYSRTMDCCTWCT